MKFKTNILCMSIIFICGCSKYGLDVKGSNDSDAKLVSNVNRATVTERNESVENGD